MSRHLNDDQISAIAAGETSAEAAAHLDGCAMCRRQVEQFEGVLGHFRGAVREWSDVQYGRPVRVETGKRLLPAAAFGWSLALVLLLAAIGYRGFTRAPETAKVASTGAYSDTVLLQHVNADISRSTPPGMETLLGFAATGTAQR